MIGAKFKPQDLGARKLAFSSSRTYILKKDVYIKVKMRERKRSNEG